jgi:hypothetical protein
MSHDVNKTFRYNGKTVHSHYDASRSWVQSELAWDMLDEMEVGEEVTDEQGDVWTRES